MSVQLGVMVGTAKVVKICDEPNTGLAVIEERGHRFILPIWLLEATERCVAAEFDRDVARAALRRYGRHDGLCGITGGYGECTCGLDAARGEP